jgi:hypothetical protein
MYNNNLNILFMKTTKGLISVLLLLIGAATTVYAQSGTTGTLTWTLDNGTLTISGEGEMPDYIDKHSPWYGLPVITVVIEEGVTSIGSEAFIFCSNLTSFTVPEGIKRIGENAFAYCSKLTSFTISGSVTNIGYFVFEGCNKLTDIIVENDNENYSSLDGILFNKAKTELIHCPGGKTGMYTIPSSVTSIGYEAFYDCRKLTSIIVPESVTSIGAWAFASCRSLTDIIVENGNENYSSLDGIMFNKVKTELIHYPGGKDGDYYTIPGSVTSIGYEAFANCSNLVSVTIPDITISIEDRAFAGTSLTSITIPNSVNVIGNEAFYQCNILTSVTNLNQEPQNIDSDVFYYVDLKKATLYVPVGSVDRYKAAEVWKEFGMIIPVGTDAIESPAAADGVSIYPNPVAESFRIDGINAPTTVTLTDIGGRAVLTQTIAGGEPVAVGHLPKGVYIVNLNGKTAKVVKK